MAARCWNDIEIWIRFDLLRTTCSKCCKDLPIVPRTLSNLRQIHQKGLLSRMKTAKVSLKKNRASEKWLTNLCSGMANTIVYARYFVKELNKTAHLYKHVTDLPLAPLPGEHAGRWEWVFSSFRSLPEDAAKVLACKSTKYKALKRVDRSRQCAVLILKILIDILCLARQD